EACGGTHLNNTIEAGRIVIIKSSKVKDGIVRITFAAGRAAEKILEEEKKELDKIAKILECKVSQIPARAKELFEAWKKAKKSKKKGEKIEKLQLKSTKEQKGAILLQTAKELQTQPQHVIKTIERFKKDIEKWSSE
ncbi:hypothetical protein D6825_03995, partial [Candidatus Woesearchaeota archaeon]